MEYIIIHKGKVNYTNWYNFDNNYVPGMIVINFLSDEFTTDGKVWEKIEEDHL